MRPIQHSSGDLIIDRRASFATALARAQDFVGAAEVMAGAVEMAPHWTAGWQMLGEFCSSAGDLAGAAEAFRQVRALDDTGQFGAALALAAHGAGQIVGTDTAYVEALFDEYAGRFEHELVTDLGYGVPPVLRQMIVEALGGQPVERSIDLGCGTGLMGVEIRPLCRRLEGVDLSARMLDEARRKGIYDDLRQGELVEALNGEVGSATLLTAADVLIYCGALPPVLSAAFRALQPGGLFAFSVELHEGAGTLLQRRQLRYAHNRDEVLADCREAGFAVVAVRRMGIRRERDAPVDGLLVVARRTASAGSSPAGASR